MTRRAIHALALTALFGCATGGATSGASYRVGDPVDINGDGEPDGVALDQDGDGIADSVDLDGDGTPDALLPGVQPIARPDASSGDGDGDGDAPSGDGDGPAGDGDGAPDLDGGTLDPIDAGGGLVLEIPLAQVPCGQSSCDILNSKVCCESWTSKGFGGESSCITEDECVKTDPTGITDDGKYLAAASVLNPDPERAVISRCDGSEDCSAGQVCCYIRYGMPIWEGLDTSVWVGPGAGRECRNADACADVGSASGVPTGVVSCNDNADCKKVPDTTCQPEQDNTASTGKNVKARAGFKVCR